MLVHNNGSLAALHGSKKSGGSWPAGLSHHSSFSCMHWSIFPACSDRKAAPSILRVGTGREGSRSECPRPGTVVANTDSPAWLLAAALALSEISAATRFRETHSSSTSSTSFVTFLFTVKKDDSIRAAEAGPDDLPVFPSSFPLPSSRNRTFPSE
jgi:hypothetical protein